MRRPASVILAITMIAFSLNVFANVRKRAIARAAAEKTALDREPGQIRSGELEKEHGRLIYSFDILTNAGIHEVNVDTKTGKVIEDSVESAADEAKEKQMESAQPK